MEPVTRETATPGVLGPGTGVIWWLTVALVGFTGMLLALGAPYLFGQGIRAGETAVHDIVAPRVLEIDDLKASKAAREQASQSVLPVFKRERSRDAGILEKLSRHLDQVALLQKQVGLPMPSTLDLTPREQVYLLEAPQELWNRTKSEVAGLSTTASAQSGDKDVEPQVETEIVAVLETQIGKTSHVTGNISATGKPDRLSIIEKYRQSFRSLVPDSNKLTPELLYLACTVKPQDLPSVRHTIEQSTRKLLQVGSLFPGVAESDWELMTLEFLPDKWDEKVRLSSARVIVSVLEPTVSIDLEATRAKTDEASAKVKTVMKLIPSGQLLVRKGGTITAEDVRILNALGITHPNSLPMLGSLFLSLLAAFLLLGVYLHSYEPKHLYSPASIGLLSTVCVATCGIAAFIGQEYPQFVPLPAAVLVLTIFISPRVAVAVLVMLLIFLSVDDLVSPNHLIALGLASGVAVGTNIKQRKDLMFRGFLIGIVQAGGFLLASILTHSGGTLAALGRDLTLQVFGGLSSCIVAIGSLPFLENIFGMVTQFRLAELTDPTQALLRQLEENAPGTYQHSLAVANLAEAGARAIGADVNLVRAGSLYHDIGKMVRPRYFIENQLGDRNPHDGMSPEESRDRVLAHVTDGLDLAQKYALPRVVQDFIPQHQGTTLMAYFYHKACLRDGVQNVDQMFYRYPGPKPQTREASIVMLADVSEAVTHSLKEPSQEEVEASMSTVFKARWDDGQFEESGLTPDELERVKKAFVRVWRTLHHERLKYPSTTTGRMAVPPEPPGPPVPPAQTTPVSKGTDKN